MDSNLPYNKNLLKHIFFNIVFLLMPVLVSTRPPGEPFFTVTRPFVRDITGNFLLLSFFYCNYYLLLPDLYFKRRYFFYIISVLFFLMVVLTLPSFLTGRFPHVNNNAPPAPAGPGFTGKNSGALTGTAFLFSELKHHFYLFFIALFFSLLERTREKLAEAKEEKLRAELSSLKSQIHPHFLFNTLNSIYILSVKKDNRAPEAILNLSSLMRYVIKEANHSTIPLKNELDYIKSYIELQRARLGNTINVQFTCTGNAGAMNIAPLILITYIENAFKHGANPDTDDCIIGITVQITQDGLHLHVFNKKAQVLNREPAGIGMKNTKERLDHLYAGKYHLEINESRETYFVTLSLKLI
ncbi:sensor histidine kinase [Parafilimonas sp.]|uniref:sensor histidine kinase n=1 Tax=Parafilimonas sp. TaxID=1969739 RepID=UPI0039E241F1